MFAALLMVGRNVTVTVCLVLQDATVQGKGKSARKLASSDITLAGRGISDIDDRDRKAAITRVLTT